MSEDDPVWALVLIVFLFVGPIVVLALWLALGGTQ